MSRLEQMAAVGAILGLLMAVGCGEDEGEELELLHTQTITFDLDGQERGPWEFEVIPLEGTRIAPGMASEFRVVDLRHSGTINRGYGFKMTSAGVEVAVIDDSYDVTTVSGEALPTVNGAFPLMVTMTNGFADETYSFEMDVEVYGPRL